MRREAVTIGRKTLSYLIAEPLEPATRHRPLSTVVFLHAFPLNAAMWQPTLDSMPAGWRALAPDYRGQAGIGMSDLAGDVVDLLDHLGIAHAAFVGCSMGGYVLFELLRSARRYVGAVGLVSTRPDSAAILETIDVPALVVHGVDDALIPFGEAESMHRAIIGSQLELMPRSGHLPNLEQPAPFERILWPFLSKL